VEEEEEDDDDENSVFSGLIVRSKWLEGMG
jgi:hypothetical protein